LLEPLKFKENPVIHSSTTNLLPTSKKQNKTKVLPGSKKENKDAPGCNLPSFPRHLQNALGTEQDGKIELNPNRSNSFHFAKVFRFLGHVPFIPSIAAYNS
jgi:hypothetical protein